MDERMVDAAERLREEHCVVVDVEDRALRLVEPVKGDLGNAVLNVLGLVEELNPVAAAARGPGGVAMGVWCNPELYLARWTAGRRWVVAYRLPGGAKPMDYVRTEGRIPTRLETANWYDAVPDAVVEAFLAAGLLVDDPPFPVPAPAAPAARPAAPVRAPKTPARRAAPASKPAARAPRPEAARRSSAARRPAPELRLCPVCQMQKAATQFAEGSGVCVDCR